MMEWNISHAIEISAIKSALFVLNDAKLKALKNLALGMKSVF